MTATHIRPIVEDKWPLFHNMLIVIVRLAAVLLLVGVWLSLEIAQHAESWIAKLLT